MKKALLVSLFSFGMSTVFAGEAMANGYRATDATDTAGSVHNGYTRSADTPIYGPSMAPHGDYATTSNKCKTCHAVHGAGDPAKGGQAYKLLRASDANDACNFCHDGVGAHTNRMVYGYSNGLTTAAAPEEFNGHRIGTSLSAIPDGLKESVGDPPNRPDSGNTLTCNTCHSVHGAKAIIFNGKKSMILRQDPYGDGGSITSMQDYSAAGSKISEFCADCHDANTEVGTSHPLSLANGIYAFSSAANCLYCHNAPGTPHGSSFVGDNMLTGRESGVNVGKSGSLGSLDDVCRRCHVNENETAGIGLSE